MAAKVLTLTGQRIGEPVKDVVEMLEEWLAKAKAGEVLAIGICGVLEGNEILSSRCENGHWAALLASHAGAHHDMLAQAYAPD